MEMRPLASFVAATELQSFTRAAESLNLTQAAVSQHVAALEKELRVSLFARTGRAVVPTDAGRTLYEYARRILTLAEQARQELTGSAASLQGTLALGASTVPSEWLLPELLKGFRALHPEVSESVTVGDSTEIIQSIETGAVEAGIVGELPRSGKLSARAIASDELVLAVPPDHTFAAVGVIDLEQLAREPLIVRESGSASRRCVELALCEAGLSPSRLRIALEVNSNDAIRAAVVSGLGAAFLSAKAIQYELQEGRLVAVEIAHVSPQRQLYLVTDTQRLPTPVGRAFLEFVAARQAAP